MNIINWSSEGPSCWSRSPHRQSRGGLAHRKMTQVALFTFGTEKLPINPLSVAPGYFLSAAWLTYAWHSWQLACVWSHPATSRPRHGWPTHGVLGNLLAFKKLCLEYKCNIHKSSHKSLIQPINALWKCGSEVNLHPILLDPFERVRHLLEDSTTGSIELMFLNIKLL